MTPSYAVRLYASTVRVVSSLAVWLSVVPHNHTVDHYTYLRVTVHSVGRLGRGCTLTRSCKRIHLTPQQVRASHWPPHTYSVCVCAGRVRNHSLHPRPLDSEISHGSIAWFATYLVYVADPIYGLTAFV